MLVSDGFDNLLAWFLGFFQHVGSLKLCCIHGVSLSAAEANFISAIDTAPLETILKLATPCPTGVLLSEQPRKLHHSIRHLSSK